jgi:hypothetical protein
LPEPGLGLKRTLPLFWGTRAWPDDDRPDPDNLVTLRDHLAFETRRALELRWRELLAERVVLGELNDLFGESMVHHDLADLLDKVEAKILELYEALCRRGERFPLPERDEPRIASLREWVRWGDIGSAEDGDVVRAAASWVPPHISDRLAAMEERLATELRAGTNGVDFLRHPE